MILKSIRYMVCIAVCFFCFVLRAEAAQDNVLTGRVKFNVATQAQSLAPLLTARLYFPKEQNKPVLVTYPDAGGNFQFSNLPTGSYLLEVYMTGKLAYQKVISIPLSQPLEITLGNAVAPSGAVARVTIVQRYGKVLMGSEFKGRVVVHVGEIDDNKPFKMFIFWVSQGESTRRYTGRIETDSLRRLIPAERVLLDTSLGLPSFSTGFRYNNKDYSLVGKLSKPSGNETVSFEIFPK
jgi:hypothetical protein